MYLLEVCCRASLKERSGSLEVFLCSCDDEGLESIVHSGVRFLCGQGSFMQYRPLSCSPF